MTKEESAIKAESKDATKTRERSGRNRGQKKEKLKPPTKVKTHIFQ